MNRDDIIRMAREAGSIDSEDVLETVYAAFAAAEREAYQNVHRLLEAHQAALEASEKPGPWPAKEVIAKAVAAEREACALLCEKEAEGWRGRGTDAYAAAWNCAHAIWERGEE